MGGGSIGENRSQWRSEGRQSRDSKKEGGEDRNAREDRDQEAKRDGGPVGGDARRWIRWGVPIN